MQAPRPQHARYDLAMQALAVLALLGSLLGAVRAQCPNVCSCAGITSTVDCRPAIHGTGFRFTGIPEGAPSDTLVLVLTGNAISSLPPDSLSDYPQLTTLVLDNNLLADVPLLDHPQLTTLRLDGNPFVTMRDGAFANLTSLQNLYIRDTPLTTLNASTFEGANSLANLYLDNNPFTELPSDLLTFISQLQLLSLTSTPLQTLPDGLFSPLNAATALVNLMDNRWSCDCNLQWLADYLAVTNILQNDTETVCHWPSDQLNQPISTVASSEFTCYPPVVTQPPQNATLLSNLTLTISCVVDSAPFPTVVWRKNGEVVNLTRCVHLEDTYSASLFFESLELSDSGVYDCSVENSEGTDESSEGEIVVLEHTCFDNLFTPEHETDVDCGGELCTGADLYCNITESCLLDRDCTGELVCLFSHSLPSLLGYISSSDPIALTCADPSIPPILLEGILRSELPTDTFTGNLSGLQTETELVASLQNLLAEQLQVTPPTLRNVRLSTVMKAVRPLMQIWFDLPRTTRMGEQAHSRLVELVNAGELRATVRIAEEGSYYQIRLNL